MFKSKIIQITVLVLMPINLSHGITIRDDVSDSNYITIATLYPNVGFVEGNGFAGSAVLIAPGWALTAAHITDGSINSVVFAPSYADRNADNTYMSGGSIWYPSYTGHNTYGEGGRHWPNQTCPR